MSNQALLQGIYDFGSMKMIVEKGLEKHSYPNWDKFVPPKDLPETPLKEGFTPIPVNSY